MSTFVVPLLSSLILLVTNSGLNMNGFQGDNGEGLKWTDYTSGVKLASETNKKVLIDVYTDWCGWCKKMDSDTYSDKSVSDYLTAKYVLVKLNAESSKKETVDDKEVTDAQIASAFGVDGYPTTIFLDSAGHPITMTPGYMKPESFITVLKYIGDDAYKSMGFQDYVKMQGAAEKGGIGN